MVIVAHQKDALVDLYYLNSELARAKEMVETEIEKLQRIKFD